MSDIQHTIGKQLSGQEERDAIHIAVIPVTITENGLRPGERVKLVFGTTNAVRGVRGDSYDGVIDPYIDLGVAWELPEGSRVWMFLKPNTVTGMRHHWAWDKLDHPVSVGDHEGWLRDFADRWQFDYDQMMGAALAAVRGERDYVVAQGVDLHSREELGEDYDIFWGHIEAITGKKVSDENREKVVWSCSC